MKWINVQTAQGQWLTLAVNSAGVLFLRDAQGEHALGSPRQFQARMGAKRRFAEVDLPDIGTVKTDEVDAIDAWFAHLDLSGDRRASTQRMSPAKLVGIIMGSIVLSIVLVLWLGVPWLADRVARSVPSEWEQGLSSGALESLAGEGFKPTQLSADKQAHYRELFARLTTGLSYDVPLQLEFRSWEGPNAFAVPGGLVLVTDQMVGLMDKDEEFLAVMAHEVGHLEMRHGLRTLLQQGGAFLVLSLIIGDTSGLGSIASALPGFLIDSAYSRDFEREADEYAFERLKAIQVSPKHFATLMQKMQDATGEEASAFKYFSSHPPTDDRIEAAERASSR